MSSTLFYLDLGVLILAILSLVLLVKNREYEKSGFENSINAMLFALLAMTLIKLIDVLVLSENIYPSLVETLGVKEYLSNFLMISQVALAPLFAVCVLVAVIFAKDAFENLS